MLNGRGGFSLGGRDPNAVLPDNGFAIAIHPRNAIREQAATFVQKKLAELNDPAAKLTPPMDGEDAIPHAVTFASLIGSYSSVYLLPDESTAGMAMDSLLMRNDLGIMECLEIRQRVVAEIDWEIVPPDKKNPGQKKLAAELTDILKSIRRFTEYRRNMQEAVWFGRAAIQHSYDKEWVGDRQYIMPKSKCKDHPGWMPIHGDKILFRYDDGREMKEGAYPHQMGIRVSSAHFPTTRDSERQRAEPTAHGMAIFLRPWERETFLVHKHMIEDADYNDIRTAGRIHGVGIRSRVHKEWILKQEVLSFMMNYLERSAGGIEIWEYPSGDKEAKKACVEAANNRSANGRNILFFPKPLGEDAALFDLKIVEAGFSGIDLINNLQDKYFGHRIKRYIIGQTLTTEADATGLGSGVADAHKDTFHQIILYDGANHEETLSEELVRTIQMYNYPETERWKFKAKLKFETEDSEEKLNGYRNAWEMGARIKEQDVLDAIGAAVPTANDRILMNPSLQQGAPGTGGASPFGTLPAGTKVVSAAVHQAMGAQMGGAGESSPVPGTQVEAGAPAQGPDNDADNDGVANEGKPNERPGSPVKYSREWTEDLHPRNPDGEFTSGNGAGDGESDSDDDESDEIDEIESDDLEDEESDDSESDDEEQERGGNLTSADFPDVPAPKRIRLNKDAAYEWGGEIFQMANAGQSPEEIATALLSGTESGSFIHEDDFSRYLRTLDKYIQNKTEDISAETEMTIDGKDWADWYESHAIQQALPMVHSQLTEYVAKQISSPPDRETREDIEWFFDRWESSHDAGSVDPESLTDALVHSVPIMRKYAAEAVEKKLRLQKRMKPEKYARRIDRQLKAAASGTHTEPTAAQREAGNYAKGLFRWKGLEIAIENPKGSERRGISSSGREWSRTMKSHYGYFRRTPAADGDQLDVHIGSHPDSDYVLVVKQIDQDSGKFDEFKVIAGCLNRKQAKKLYLANYPSGWKCGPAASMTVDQFKRWIEKGGPMKSRSIDSVLV